MTTIVGNSTGCPNCKAAETAMKTFGVEGVVHVDAFSDEGQRLLTLAGVRTIPAFFESDRYLGDYQWFLREGLKSLRG